MLSVRVLFSIGLVFEKVFGIVAKTVNSDVSHPCHDAAPNAPTVEKIQPTQMAQAESQYPAECAERRNCRKPSRSAWGDQAGPLPTDFGHSLSQFTGQTELYLPQS